MKQILSKAERDENDRRVGKALREYLEVGGQCRFSHNGVSTMNHDDKYWFRQDPFTIKTEISETGRALVIETHTDELREKIYEAAVIEEQVYTESALKAKKRLASLK